MSLRTKLLLVLSVIVMMAAVSPSVIVYFNARDELERAAEKRLRESSGLLAEQVQRRFDDELRKFEYWAAMPMVVRTALRDNDPDLLSAFDRYFSAVVDREPYSSIYLINLRGDCVASDDPCRVRHPYSRSVVSKKPDAVAGFEGNASIGLGLLSPATGRPIVPLTAPVRHRGRVVAILRTSIDIGRLSQELLASLSIARQGRLYMFDPALPLALPEGQKLQTPIERPPYAPPPEALRAAFDRATGRVFRYRDQKEEYMVAYARMQRPPCVFLVSQPMSEILAPVRTLRQITIVVVALMLALLALSIGMLTAPVVRGIERCREFTAEIMRGRLDRRLKLSSHDEVGQLASDLNDMAGQLQLNYQALEKAERKYRGIFERAVEGIFQTDVSGEILIANPALAAILGVSSPDELVGQNVRQFYADPKQRDELLERLRGADEVSGFALELRRADGSVRQAMLHARVERGDDGDIRIIRGILQDFTERLNAEAGAKQARETEELLVRTELEMLRYQINPHFLFNALNSVRELVISDPPRGVRMLDSLAAFCRASLVDQSDTCSTLADELRHAGFYLEIQQVRFGQRLLVDIDADERAVSVGVPAFIIQPLIENAVKYGRQSRANPLHVGIRAYLDGPNCVVTVSNTGRWFEPGNTEDKSSARLGLNNVRRRLDRFYDKRAGLTVREDGGRVIVTLNFPSASPAERDTGKSHVICPDGRIPQ